MEPISRRDFVMAGGAAVLLRGTRPEDGRGTLTAGEVVGRIKDKVGIPWRSQTVDQIVAGDETTTVRGIASVMMATQDVVERAAAEGKNMIVTHETPFYLHQDHTDDIRDNAVLRYKRDFLQRHGMAIFHFHDHWHARHPDGIASGMVRQLGWERYQDDPQNPKRLTFPNLSLERFARDIHDRLEARTMRVVGDPRLSVGRVQTSWGYVGREGGIAMLAHPDVDVLVAGETREWELVEYARDAVTAGQRKALVLVGHVLSEQGGMILCADWLRSFLPEVPVAYIPTPEPCWNPGHPVRG